MVGPINGRLGGLSELPGLAGGRERSRPPVWRCKFHLSLDLIVGCPSEWPARPARAQQTMHRRARHQDCGRRRLRSSRPGDHTRARRLFTENCCATAALIGALAAGRWLVGRVTNFSSPARQQLRNSGRPPPAADDQRNGRTGGHSSGSTAGAPISSPTSGCKFPPRPPTPA